jgi:SAM-dependent methyltransferase
VGGGSSLLTQRLRECGHCGLAALDISAAALERAKARIGDTFRRVQWIVADVTSVQDVGTFDVWHDRAVFHFLTAPADREKYAALLRRTIPPGGHAVISTFAPDGPTKCSGLDVVRYDAASLAAELGRGFTLLKSVPETHLTPTSKLQSFQYAVFRRTAD